MPLAQADCLCHVVRAHFFRQFAPAAHGIAPGTQNEETGSEGIHIRIERLHPPFRPLLHGVVLSQIIGDKLSDSIHPILGTQILDQDDLLELCEGLLPVLLDCSSLLFLLIDDFFFSPSTNIFQNTDWEPLQVRVLSLHPLGPLYKVSTDALTQPFKLLVSFLSPQDKFPRLLLDHIAVLIWVRPLLQRSFDSQVFALAPVDEQLPVRVRDALCRVHAHQPLAE